MTRFIADASSNSKIFMIRYTTRPPARGLLFLALLVFLILRGLSMAAPAPRVILFLGDSITAGYGLDPATGLSGLDSGKNRCARLEFQSRQRRARAAIPAPAVLDGSTGC